MSFEMIVILGRGIQRLSENGPWVLTEDLEVCDERSTHLPVRVPVDDENPFCMVGGGEMNLQAGIELINKYRTKIAVCAYGARSGYLESIDAPSESEVMSEQLICQIHSQLDIEPSGRTYLPEVVVWERHRRLPVPSNTRQELLNVFDLALECGLKRIALVAIGVHVPRTTTCVAKHLSVYEKYRVLFPVVLESEEILLAANCKKYGPRVKALRNSKAFARNWERETVGISKIIRDAYGDAKPLVITPQ